MMSFIQVTILALVFSQAGGVHDLLDDDGLIGGVHDLLDDDGLIGGVHDLLDVGGLIDDVLGLLGDLIGIIVSVLGVGVNLDLGIRLDVNVRIGLRLDTNVLHLGKIYLGFGHNGNIIGSEFRTPSKCIDACDKNVLCKGASWDEHGNCNLHFRIDECNVFGHFHDRKSLLFVKEDGVLGLLDGVLGLLGGLGIDLGIRLGVDLGTHLDRTASGYIYPGFAHIGNYIDLGVKHSASECINACNRDAKCKGATWDGACRHHFMIDNTKVIKYYRRDNKLLFVKISLSGCVYPGFGHSGNNIRSGYSSTPSECINECNKNGQCKGSTWDKNNQCWPHSIIDESKVSGNFQGGSNSQLFVRECLIGRRYTSFGHRGNDLRGGFPTTAGGCAAACIADDRCAGSTWDQNANCYLHSKIEEIRVCGNFQNGNSELFVKTSLTGCRYPSFGHSGNDMKGGFSTTAGGCAAACIADDKCAGSTWDKDANCYLHFKIEESRVSGNFQGGKSELFVKLCLAGCRYPSYGQSGNDLKGGFPTSAGGCAAACIAEDKCAGSTWDKNANCYLHSKMEQSRISGNFQGGKSELFVKNCQKM